ncbi:MAG: serine/threonine-protein kinase [Phycisphaeraceae bacterium]
MSELHEIAGYEIVATLGHGARSTIYHVRDRRREQYALKRVVKATASDQRYLDQAIREHQIARRFDHPSIRKSHRLLRQRNFIRTSEVLVLMELVLGKTLEQHQPKRLADLVLTCRHAAEGLAVMHEQGYVHADIKPNNIMINQDGAVKIIDFGQSCPSGTIKNRIQGTPDYIAPEQVQRKRIIPQTDIFNLGATMYWLLTRQHVPTMMPKGQAGMALKTETRCAPPIEHNPEVPPALSSLVMDCIERHPSERPDTMVHVIDRIDIALAQLQRRDVSGGGSGGRSGGSGGVAETQVPRRNAS